MTFIERVMRVMTHINIGAALGLTAWVLGSGWQVVAGHMSPASAPTELRMPARQSHAGTSTPMELVPVRGHGGAVPLCHGPQPAIRRTDMAAGGVEL